MNFDDFIFPKSLSSKLQWWLNNSTTVVSPICFYGLPGSGKTTFAQFIAEQKSGTNNILNVDMNSHKMDGDNLRKEVKKITDFAITNSFFDSGEWGKVLILDEFHNLSFKEQDTFKMRFDEWNNLGIQIIICLNISNTNSINKVLSTAIKSRCECINFSYSTDVVDEVMPQVIAKYPNLKPEDIRCLLPDLRQIDRQSKLYGGKHEQ